MARPGKAGWARRVAVWHGADRTGTAGKARCVQAGKGEARQAWCSEAGLGK